MQKTQPIRVIILGAAGRDFHNFNMVYRNDPGSQVVAFTAAQIPEISGRFYPSSLAGDHYPEGIPIIDEAELEQFCSREHIDQVVFAYSDVAHAFELSIPVCGQASVLCLYCKSGRWVWLDS